MSTPTTRAEFKAFCLRKLGFPVVKMNVSEEQVDDRIDEALQYFADYHFDGAEQTYYKYQVTDLDKANGYIDLPENIIGVVDLFDIGDSMMTNNMFNVRYQFMMNFINEITSMRVVPYVMSMQYLQLLEEILVGKQPLRFNRHQNRLFIDMDWDRVTTGYYIIVSCWRVLDPETYPDVWNDRWLQRYATCLIKEQWGNNLTKFVGQNLMGGVQFNGEKILNDAVAERAKLEDEMINSYSLPTGFIVG